MSAQSSFQLGEEFNPKGKIIKSDMLIDRWSRYGFCISEAKGKDDMLQIMKELKIIKPFSSADHLSYAFRLRSKEGIIYEWNDDDGETWAWLCILRELKRENIENAILIVSRHFGWEYLQRDRYKNLVDVSRIAISEIKNTW